MIGEYTENVKIINDNLKSRDFVTTDGEIVSLSETTLDGLSMDIVNYSEQLAGVDEHTVASEETRRILKILEDKNEFKEHIKLKYGSFYFSYYNRVLNELKSQYLTRALYLCSFMNYDNMLVEGSTRPRPIYEDDIQRILRLGRTEMFKTKKELIRINFLIVNDDKTLSINEKFCKKGDIMKNKKVEKARVFNVAIKELYENATPLEHKKLALLFKMLPYINLRWNIVCNNIEEEIKDKVVPLTIKTLAEILEQSNVTKLKKDLLSLTVGGKPVVVITSVLDKNAILINPSIYYKGTTLKDVMHIEQIIDSTLGAI